MAARWSRTEARVQRMAITAETGMTRPITQLGQPRVAIDSFMANCWRTILLPIHAISTKKPMLHPR